MPENAFKARVRLVVSGHGTCEFRPSKRTLKVNGKVFKNTLWTTDVYLNPKRPQGGTWKYERAGWGPGSVARVWEVDVSELISADGELHLEYTPQDHQFKKWAEHWLEGQAIFEK